MNLNDYPTPETDAFYGHIRPQRESLAFSRQLEREAAAWRDVAEKYHAAGNRTGLLIEADEAFDRLLSETNKTDEHSA